jgi:hypothetical protein
MRVLLALALLRAVSADSAEVASFVDVLYEKGVHLWRSALTSFPYLDENKENAPKKFDQREWGPGPMRKFREDMRKARQCRWKCGEDAECAKKCPKPWMPIVKACEDFPKIQECHSSCNGAACDKCPKFEENWMNQRFARNPEKAAEVAKKKCPEVKKAHECHQACKLGDFECHHKCPSMFHDGGHPWHRRGDHHNGPMMQKFRKAMREARECHRKCGPGVANSDCHAKCPKPLKPIAKACKDYPKIKECQDKCKDADCQAKCPKLDEEWMNKRVKEFPKRAEMFANKKCPVIEKAWDCHQACTPGDWQCHSKCPRPFPNLMKRHRGHHGRSHGDVLV